MDLVVDAATREQGVIFMEHGLRPDINLVPACEHEANQKAPSLVQMTKNFVHENMTCIK